MANNILLRVINLRHGAGMAKVSTAGNVELAITPLIRLLKVRELNTMMVPDIPQYLPPNITERLSIRKGCRR